LQTVSSSLGDKLKKLLEYLGGKTVNEALVTDSERSPDLLLELLIAALTIETEDSAHLFFRVLRNALPDSSDKQGEMLAKVADSLASRALKIQERFAEAIILVVSCFGNLLT
jgi:hypothetical protein